MAQLTLDGPLHSWSDTAIAARLGSGAHAIPGVAFLGPEPFGPVTGGTPEDLARPWLGVEADGVLTLMEVVPLGTRHAWIYRRVDAVGLSRLTGSHGASIRVSAEIVAKVADTLQRLGPRGVAHPGPSPEDVGIDALGNVHLLGFVNPWPPSPVLRDPAAGEPGEAIVWRLGILLARLLGGTVHAVSDQAAHEAMIRRVLIRAMSRSGPIFTERYRDWLSGMLSWEAGQRPALSSIGAGLRDVATSLGGDDLASWAAKEVPKRLTQPSMGAADASFHPWQEDADRSVDEPPSGPPSATVTQTDLPVLSATATLPGISLHDLPEDVTAEATLLPSGKVAPVSAHTVEPGTMPVKVGPPVEVVTKRAPSLPHDFLDGGAPLASDEPVVPWWLRALLFLLFGGALALLTLVAVLMALSF